MCNAVFPFFVAASTFAPLFNSSVTISTWPSFDAKCNAFKPFWKKRYRSFIVLSYKIHKRCVKYIYFLFDFDKTKIMLYLLYTCT